MVSELVRPIHLRARNKLRSTAIIVTIEPYPSAEMVFHRGDEFADSVRYHAPQRQSDILTTMNRRARCPMLHRTFYGTTMETLGTIWHDTTSTAQ